MSRFAAVLFVVALVPFGVLCADNVTSTLSPTTEPMSWPSVANLTMTVVRRCLDRANTTECFRGKVLKALDLAIRDGHDWHLNDFVTFGRDPDYAMQASTGRDRRQDYDEESISGKLNELMRSRRVQFQTSLLPIGHSEGRKKKNKHGGMMWMGGLAMAAMYAQMVLGKITMLAAAAFVMAKIALLVATSVSLKKHVATTSTGTTEHIVYADHSGGHNDGYRRNTFRSMGQYAVPSPYPYEVNEELKDRDIRYLDALK